MNKEIVKKVYRNAGEKVFYHYHKKGFKTILIKAGSIQTVANGQQFILEEGDMITFEPFCPHGFEVLTEDTEVREIYTAYTDIENYCELYDPADVIDVNKKNVRFAACKGTGRHIFRYDGIKFIQKAARYQLGGNREMWEYQIEKGYTLQFEAEKHEEKVYFIESGTYKVETRDNVYETSAEKEAIVIPVGTPYKVTALTDDCVLHNYNVKTHLFRLLEMLEATEEYFKEKLEDKEYINYLFDVNKLTNFVGFKKDAEC